MGKAYVPPRVLQEALCVISGVPELRSDSTSTEELAQELLIISHHPSLVAVQSGLWPALLTRMKIDPEAFITRHLDHIVPRITTQRPLNQVMGWELEEKRGRMVTGKLGLLRVSGRHASWLEHRQELRASFADSV